MPFCLPVSFQPPPISPFLITTDGLDLWSLLSPQEAFHSLLQLHPLGILASSLHPRKDLPRHLVSFSSHFSVFGPFSSTADLPLVDAVAF